VNKFIYIRNYFSINNPIANIAILPNEPMAQYSAVA
jgi:hypothetical protein